ncbi:MAG TPA: hypothetical protein VIX83_09545 [Candidatus Cybelea sp.]
MNPTLALFLRLTAVIAVGLVLLVILSHLLLLALKAVIIAAVIAAIVIGCFFVYNLFRRNKYPVIR